MICSIRIIEFRVTTLEYTHIHARTHIHAPFVFLYFDNYQYRNSAEEFVHLLYLYQFIPCIVYSIESYVNITRDSTFNYFLIVVPNFCSHLLSLISQYEYYGMSFKSEEERTVFFVQDHRDIYRGITLVKSF